MTDAQLKHIYSCLWSNMSKWSHMLSRFTMSLCSWLDWRSLWWRYCCNNSHACYDDTYHYVRPCDAAVCHPPCENGGNCTLPGYCTCESTWEGVRCETRKSVYLNFIAYCYCLFDWLTAGCSPDCQNGGECYEPGSCHCTTGWFGERCEEGRLILVIWSAVTSSLSCTHFVSTCTYSWVSTSLCKWRTLHNSWPLRLSQQQNRCSMWTR